MTARRFVASLLLLPLALICAGSASLHPRLTLLYERTEAETVGGPRPVRTTGNKAGASLSIDLPQTMSNPRPKTSKETPGFIRQIEAADKMLLCEFAFVLLWAARLQWNVADLQRQVTEITTVVKDIQDDRRAKIKDAEAWRAEIDKANVKRDLLLEQLTHIATTAEKPTVRTR